MVAVAVETSRMGAAGRQRKEVPVPACQHELACHIGESGKNERSTN